MAMPRSAIRLAFRQSAPASRFFGNGGDRKPASSFTSKRNYDFHRSKYEFVQEDFTHWGGVEYFIGGCTIAGSLLFAHIVMFDRPDNRKKSTSYTGHYGQEKAEKKRLSEASMSN